MNVFDNRKSDADEFSNIAEELFSENKNKEAIKFYLNSILIKRINPKAYKGLGISFKCLKKFDKAIMYLEKAKELTPFDYEIYRELGICYLGKGKKCLAAKNLIQAIKLNPDNPDIQAELAFLHEFMQEPEMALMIYDKIIDANPDYQKAYIHKAALLMQENRYIQAIDVFKQILKINPDYSRSYLGIGICFDKLAEKSKAKRYYKKYLSLNFESINSENVVKRLLELKKELPSKQNFLKVV